MSETTPDSSDRTALYIQSGIQMRKGLLVYCVLLLCKGNKVYSSDITRQLRGAHLVVVEGTLYPIMGRLVRDELVAYEWQESEQGPPRKYYWLTEQGELLLDALRGSYHSLHQSVEHLEKGKI